MPSNLALLLSLALHSIAVGAAMALHVELPAPPEDDSHFDIAFRYEDAAAALANATAPSAVEPALQPIVAEPVAEPAAEVEAAPEAELEAEAEPATEPEPELALEDDVSPEPNPEAAATVEAPSAVETGPSAEVARDASAPASRVLEALVGDNAPPEYPRRARQRGWQGEAWLRIDVDERGAVVRCVVARSSGYDILDRAAVDAVRQWRYRGGPGTTEVAVRFVLR